MNKIFFPYFTIITIIIIVIAIMVVVFVVVVTVVDVDDNGNSSGLFVKSLSIPTFITVFFLFLGNRRLYYRGKY